MALEIALGVFLGWCLISAVKAWNGSLKYKAWLEQEMQSYRATVDAACALSCKLDKEFDTMLEEYKDATDCDVRDALSAKLDALTPRVERANNAALTHLGRWERLKMGVEKMPVQP